MSKFVFRDGMILHNGRKANPQRIGAELEKIAKRNGGGLTPAATLEAARSEKHYLHRHFEWQDGPAAEKYRLIQARQLITCIRVVENDADGANDDSKRLVWLSVNEPKKGRAYRTRDAVQTSVVFQEMLFLDAERDLAAWERRYCEIADFCEEIRGLRERMAHRRRALLEEYRERGDGKDAA
jgi:hypothetical protein